MAQRTLLVVSQVYRPDPAAVGQYIADVAEDMVRRGWRVVVLTADHGYDDTTISYPSRERVDGVDVVRLPLSSWGKRSIAWRLIGGMIFVAQSVLRALFMQRVDALLISTSPPLAPLAAVVLRTVRRTPVLYWVMDLNPDQFVALGHAAEDALVVRSFDAMNRAILRASSVVVVLDRFMATRVLAKLDVPAKVRVIPPWSRDDQLSPVAHTENQFRVRNGWADKLVVMYSGNHGPSNPLKTLIGAARELRDDPRFVFAFIGGGVGKREVDEAARECPNIVSLPYQPLAEIRHSLSAADVHVVTVGDEVVGIVHPSKVYGALAVGRPVLLIGPERSHVGDMIEQSDCGWQVDHGDVAGLVAIMNRLGECRGEIVSAGENALATAARFGTATLREEFCGYLEEISAPR